jgi:ribose/xylose/arabinose/galactoside ABC-type transport system permease subunit
VLLGGTSLFGGAGGAGGTALGVIFVGLLQNGLIIGGIPSFWQQIVTGAILVLAVGVGTLTGADSALLKWRIRRLADLRETSRARGREVDETR